MYSSVHSLPEFDEEGDFDGSLDGSNVPGGDPRLVLASDPKPRLRWTSELHDRFVDAVTQLGGPDKATPKTIMRTMDVKGLTLYHLKSHLQKYRMGKLSCKELAENSKDAGTAASCVAESQETDSSSSCSRIAAQTMNDGYHVTEALRVQMEVQRRLHDQLEVQRRLQLRIEAQAIYLQSILEKACKALNDQTLASVGLEAAREDLSELAIKVANECQQVITVRSLSDVAATLESKNSTNTPFRISDCSVDSCLTTNESPVSPPMGLSTQAAALKKRPRPMFSSGDLSLLDSSQRQVEWMMSNNS